MPNLTGKKAFAILFAIAAIGILFFFFRPENIPAPEKTMPSQEIAAEPGRQPTEEVSPFAKRTPSKEGLLHTLPEKETLPLRLVGTYEHTGDRVACIEDLALSKMGEYRIGDSVMDATVIQILSGQVVLLKGGQRTVLTLEGSYNWARPDDWIDTLSQDSFIVSKARLNQKVLDVNQLLCEAVPVPYVSRGRMEGFSIRFLKKDGIVNQAGFKEGDIIKGVNGEKLDSLKKPLQIYKSLLGLVRGKQEPTITVELQRGKKTHTFTYRILHN